MRSTLTRSIGAAALTAALIVGGCGNDQDGEEATTASQEDAVKQISITVVGDEITPPPGIVDVAVGTTVRIVVASDEVDELHVHGYDESVEPVEVGRDTAATIEFVADRHGLFYVELHHQEKVLFQLRVQ